MSAPPRVDRRPRALGIAAVAVVLGGLVVVFGPELRFKLQHREGAWKAEDAEKALEPNAVEDAKKWEAIEALFQRGLALMHAGDSEGAARAFKRVLDLDSSIVDARVNRGFCLIALEDWHDALVEFELAIAMKPEQANAYYGLALVLYQLDDVASALGHMRTYVHLAGEGAPFQEKAMTTLLAWEDELRILRADDEPPPP